MRPLPQRLGKLVYITAVAVVIGVVAGASGGSLYNLVSRQVRATNQPPSILDGKLVRVAVSDSPGFAMYGSGVFAGFDIDLVNYLLADTRVVGAYVETSLPERISVLQSGAVQLAAGLAITAERRRFADFAGPYLVSPYGLMTKPDDDRIRTIDDLAGKSICVVEGTTSGLQFRPLPYVVEMETSLSKCADRVRAGQVDVVAGDMLMLRAIDLADPKRSLKVSDVTFGGESRYGIALPPGHTADCQKLTLAIKRFILAGRWDQSFQRHFGSQGDISRFRPDPDRLDPCPQAR